MGLLLSESSLWGALKGRFLHKTTPGSAPDGAGAAAVSWVGREDTVAAPGAFGEKLRLPYGNQVRGDKAGHQHTPKTSSLPRPHLRPFLHLLQQGKLSMRTCPKPHPETKSPHSLVRRETFLPAGSLMHKPTQAPSSAR